MKTELNNISSAINVSGAPQEAPEAASALKELDVMATLTQHTNTRPPSMAPMTVSKLQRGLETDELEVALLEESVGEAEALCKSLPQDLDESGNALIELHNSGTQLLLHLEDEKIALADQSEEVAAPLISCLQQMQEKVATSLTRIEALASELIDLSETKAPPQVKSDVTIRHLSLDQRQILKIATVAMILFAVSYGCIY